MNISGRQDRKEQFLGEEFVERSRFGHCDNFMADMLHNGYKNFISFVPNFSMNASSGCDGAADRTSGPQPVLRTMSII